MQPMRDLLKPSWRRLAQAGGALLLFLLACTQVALAANPAAVQTYYIPLREDDALTSMRAISASAAGPVWTYISVAIGTNNTFVYYDHWENGYDADIANPANLYSAANPGGTQIWGNGIAADGCPPNRDGKTPLACTDANDVLQSGNVIVLANAVDPTTLQSVIDFDGSDKIGATQQIAVSRVYWPNSAGTLLAAAIELYPTRDWGEFYQSPVGEDNNYYEMFQYTSMAIQASENGTQVTVDINGSDPGGVQPVVTLNQGQSFVVNNVDEGATAAATFPVQVHLLTGDRDSTYEYSGYTLVPKEDWSARYYTSVGVTKTNNNPVIRTQITFFNGGADLLTIQCHFRNSTQNVGVAAGGTAILEVPDRSGAECVSINPVGAPFFAISTVDAAGLQRTGGESWDWGLTLAPEQFLSPQALVGLGLGRDPTSSTSPNQNGSPIFVAPFCTSLTRAAGTYLYADFNGDGTPDTVDLNGDNDTADTVDGINEATSAAGMLVTHLQSVRLFDPTDRNQTGMRISTRTGPNYTGDPGCDIVAVWGEDPNVASAGAPGFDVGTSIPPLRSFTGLKTAEQARDVDGDGYLTPGDWLTYTIEAQNTGISAIAALTFSDTIPTGASYIPNSTYVDWGSGWVLYADGVTGTPFPLDEGGIVAPVSMPVDTTFRVRFLAEILPFEEGVCNLVIRNTAFIGGQGKELDVGVYSLVQCTGRIVVEKAVRGANPPAFNFTGEAHFEYQPPPGSPANNLPSQASIQPPANGSSALTFTVPTGLYTVTEELVPGWPLYEIKCNDGGVPFLDEAKAVYNMFGPNTIKCTFFNEVPGQLTVAKVTQPAVDPQRFDFKGGPNGSMEVITGTLGGGESATFEVRPGAYFVTETVPSGWSLLKIECDDPAAKPAPDPWPGEIPEGGTGGAIYDIAPGEHVTCTWTNVKAGTIILQKYTSPPNTPGEFAFTGAFTTTLSHGESISRTVSPGTHTVTETVPPGWTLNAVVCNDSDSVQVGNSVVYHVAAGETVSCTFFNDLYGRLVVAKQTNPANAPDQFAFTGAITTSLRGGQAFTQSVPAGQQTITETVPAFWQLESIICDDPEGFITPPSATVYVPPGGTRRCTFSNVELSSLGDFVWHDLNKNGIQEAGEPGLANIQVRLFQVSEQPTAAGAGDVQVAETRTSASGLYLFRGLEPGAYFVIVTVPTNFAVSPPNQGTDPTRDSVIDPAGRSNNVTLPIATADLDVDAGIYDATPTADDPSPEPGGGRTIYLPAVRD